MNSVGRMGFFSIDEETGLLKSLEGELITNSEWLLLKEEINYYYECLGDEDIILENQRRDYLRKKIELEYRKRELRKPKKLGRVYFIGSDETGVKIGFSMNVDSRLKTLNVASPYKLKILGITPECGNYVEVEKWAHDHFESKRMNSEWFDITEEEIDTFLGGLTFE